LLHTRNSAPSNGQFSCSSPLFNRIYQLIQWAIKSNFQSVLTDCPHREKLGWMEQTHLMGGGIHYNFSINHLYQQLVMDMMDSQEPNGLVPDIAPEYVEFDGGFRDSPEWGSAAVILPWYIYKWYGNQGVIEDAWPMMKKYVDYLSSKADANILSHGLGDWYDLGPKFPGEAQLTPKALTATATYYYDAALLSKMACLLGKVDDSKKYFKLSEEIKQSFNQKFFDDNTKIYSTGSQTAMSMPLCVGLVENENIQKVFNNLVLSIENSGKALTAGDVGFHYLIKALEEGGAAQLIFEMNNRDDIPGYGYQLKKGATALTESWAALREVSNNHLMLGHIMEWFYSGLAGIGQTEDSAAYKTIIIKPQFVEGIDWAKASYDCPNGTIESSWRKSKSTISLSVRIPVNSTALVHIPVNDMNKIRVLGKTLTDLTDMIETYPLRNEIIFRVGSGRYDFEISR
jgi:alpha-L-rhamnosidase